MIEIGESLREARCGQGLELAQVGLDIKVPSKYLRAIEWERFDLLPDDARARGYLAAYAAHLGLDVQPYLDEFASRFGGETERRRLGPAHRLARRILIAVTLASLVATAVIAVWNSGADDASRGDPPAGTAG